MHENKLFVSASRQPTITTQQSPPAVIPATDTAAEEARIAAKKAASLSRSGKTTGDSKVDYNPLTMSDEDFAKLNKLHI